MPLIGIIANPSSGKDIRRLVADADGVDNQQKARIVRRALRGIAATAPTAATERRANDAQKLYWIAFFNGKASTRGEVVIHL